MARAYVLIVRFKLKQKRSRYEPGVCWPPQVGSEQEASVKPVFTRFAKDQSGATAIEYGLIAALVAVACITVITTLGSNLSAKFKQVADNLQ